jgi:lipopolysaccharide export LptBFGC system permease protein LptF
LYLLRYRLGFSVAVDGRRCERRQRRVALLWTIAVILLVLWVLGLVGSYTVGGLIHLLLVAAVIVIVFQFISGRRSV